jgi:hypothetical protein
MRSSAIRTAWSGDRVPPRLGVVADEIGIANVDSGSHQKPETLPNWQTARAAGIADTPMLLSPTEAGIVPHGEPLAGLPEDLACGNFSAWN